MLKIAFSKSAMSKTRVYKWYKHFQEGFEDFDNDEGLDALAPQEPMTPPDHNQRSC